MILCIRELFAGELFVLALCGFSAADMAFLFVFVEYRLHLVVKGLVYFLKLFRYVLMNGALAYSELPRGRSYGRVVFYDIFSECHTSFVFTCRGILQCYPPLNVLQFILCGITSFYDCGQNLNSALTNSGKNGIINLYMTINKMGLSDR